MKIAIVHKRYATTGGTERYVYNFSRYAVSQGHEVHIVAQKFDLEPIKGIYFHQVSSPSKPSLAQVWGFLTGSRKVLARINPDVVLGCGKTFPQDIYRSGGGCHSTFLKSRIGGNVLMKLKYCTNPLHQLILWIEKRKFDGDNCKKIVAVSNIVKEDIIKSYGVSPEKIVVIHNGVNLNHFSPYGKEEAREKIAKQWILDSNRIWLVFVGHEFKRKGLESIIDALTELDPAEQEKFVLLVVGKGKKSDYMSKIDQIKTHVVFTGPVSEPVDYYKSSDIFVLPTHFDPFSNVCVEALGCGLPVVTTKMNGASEVLTHGKDGFLMENPNDITTLVKALRELMDKDKRNIFSQNALETARKCDFKLRAEEMMNLCKSIKK